MRWPSWLGGKSTRWIANRIGPILIADANGDGYDDCLGWFTDFGRLKRIRLTVIDGRSGEHHYSVESGAGRAFALVGTRLVTALDTTGRGGVVLPPCVELSDLRECSVITRQNAQSGVNGLYLDGGDVLAYLPGGAFRVRVAAGTIEASARSDAALEPARLLDHSRLSPNEKGAEATTLAQQLKLRDAHARRLTAGSWLLSGLLESGAPALALAGDGGPRWQSTLSGPESSPWVPRNAVANDELWFVPRVERGVAHLTALDRATGVGRWEVELGNAKAALAVSALSAGRDLVGLVYEAGPERDELLLIDVAARRVAFRYRRD